MNKRYVMSFGLVFAIFAHYFIDASQQVTQEMCQYALRMSNLASHEESPTPHETFALLKDFFTTNSITNYAVAAQFGRQNALFENPDDFNKQMSAWFKPNGTDIVPEEGKRYQAIVFTTSGIDVFMERLAFLSRLGKKHAIQTEALIALTGNHPHRKDLRERDYLLQLPRLFSDDFDLSSFNEVEVADSIDGIFNLKQNWNHQDGMKVAWSLVACDKVMAKMANKFDFFNCDGLRTDELFERFVENGLPKPVAQENPIAFIVNAQGASNVKEMIKKQCPHLQDVIDVLVARPASEEIEAVLFNDTPQQRAMSKLFHFYRLLEIVTK